MCGIAGILFFDRQKLVSVDLLEDMTDIQAHRGPDDRGFLIKQNVGLGHRRLSIIDLSGGHQPISNEDGTCHIIFNGEIYNYLQLRQELEKKGHIFTTLSDTEVILHCYEEYGEGCPKKLNGMFAFAIWDEKKQLLFLARDRVGIKPLFYYMDHQKILFGSEIKSILQDSTIERKVDYKAFDAYFSYMYIPEPYTIFQGIKKLPPAHTLTIENGEMCLKRYWDVPYIEETPRREDEYAEELYELLQDSVRIRLMSEVPLGVFLSGGIDSSSVTGLMAQVSAERIKTFSISGGTGKFNELPYARLVAQKYNTEHHEFEVVPEQIQDLLPVLIGYLDEPFADPSIIPTYYVSKIARQKLTVALSGEGGDELFGGYVWHIRNMQVEQFRNAFPDFLRRYCFARIFPDPQINACLKSRWHRYLRQLSIANDISLLSPGTGYQKLMSLFSFDLKQSLYEHSCMVSDTFPVIQKAFDHNQASHPLDKTLYADLRTYLPGDLLTKVDRMSMANSLEVRVPFLDYRLIEFAARVPAQWKLPSGILTSMFKKSTVSKYILKQSMTNILPPQIKQRKEKRGFSIPVDDWFKGHLKSYAEEILLDSSSRKRGFFSEATVMKILKQHQEGTQNYGSHIWALIVFQIWASKYL